MTPPAITYARFTPGDQDQILALYNQVFASRRIQGRWRWEYLHNPAQRMDMVLAFCGPTLVGHAAGVPASFRHEDRLVLASRSQNGFVHPDFQRRGIYLEALSRYTDDLTARGVDFVFGFPNRNSFPSFMKSGGYGHLCDIYPFNLRIDGRVTDAPPRAAIEIEDAPAFRPQDVAFFARALSGFSIVQNRDAAYLAWRYHPDAGHPYRIVRAFDGGEQIGLAVVKAYPDGGTIDLVELAFRSDAGALLSALRAVSERFAEQGLNAFSVWSMEHDPLYPLLRSIGFEREERPTHVIYRALSSRCSRRVSDPSAYYLSMGDSDVY